MQVFDVGEAPAEEVDAPSEGEEGMEPILHTPYSVHRYHHTMVAIHKASGIQLPDGRRCCRTPL